MLKEEVKTINTARFTYFVQDKHSEFNASDILKSSTLQRSNKDGNQGITEGVFWSKLRLKNDSNKSRTLILYNPLAGINYLDVYLYQKEVLKKRILLGDMREQKSRDFLNRYSAFELLLAPHEEITIVSKIDNFSVIYIAWIIEDTKVFIERESKFLILFSLVTGSFIFFIIVSFMYYLVHKEITYLIISFYIFISFSYQFAIQGIFYALDIGLNLELNTFISWSASQFGAISLLLFTYYFFEMKKNYKKLSYLLYFLLSVNIVLLLANLYALLIEEEYFMLLTPLYNLFYMLSIIFTIVLGFYIKVIGHRYYLLGQSFMFFALIIHSLALLGIIEFYVVYRYLITLSVFVDIILLFIAQSLKTQEHLKALSTAKVMLIEQSRFASMGQAIGHISHQWKHPLTLIGTSVSLLETILRHDKKNTLMHLENELPSMTHSIKHMKKTMMEFSNYYSANLKKVAFSPRETLDNSIALLSAKSTLKNAQITLDIDEDFKIINYEHICSNIMIILIDNSLDEFEYQNDNQILISMKLYKKQYIIRYKDNAGGIKIKPIEKVFEYFVSSKGETTGHGIGLAMVKMLVEDRLNGSISVKNREGGVVFEICFEK
ncbi:Signal Transduction Histidine Kinase (STHK) with CheB and CheR activity [hydrothermal vent metagenome]|uniref:histidine kinase n=1 Tax=hydrothermal vent metagenome TaxID=652676 RepID=A0A1W1CZ14_9ZZZZ